jgi:chromosome segregation ATPase
MRRTREGIGGMTVDREKKIAEIRKSAEEARKTDRSWVDGQDYADDVEFLLDELERERAAHNAHVTELCQLEEKNRKLLEERDEARSKAEEAWKEIDSLEEQLLSAQQDRDKLIEGLRWYAYDIKYMNWPSELWINQGQRARDILKEIGVTDV